MDTSEMNDDSVMQFEWEHTEADCLTVIEYQVRHMGFGALATAERRKGRRIVFLSLCFVVIIYMLFNFNGQSLFSVIGIILAIAIWFWMLVVRQPKTKAIIARANKIAKGYFQNLSVLPTGTRRMKTDGYLIDWYWVDGEERFSYPARTVEAVQVADARLYLIRRGEAADSIPFHAFGDQENRMAFVQLIEESRKVEEVE